MTTLETTYTKHARQREDALIRSIQAHVRRRKLKRLAWSALALLTLATLVLVAVLAVGGR